MIKANRGRILVKLLPRYSDFENKLGLKLVDKAKHFDGVRRGVVQSVGRDIFEVKVGDTVIFRGDAGFSLDGDPESGKEASDDLNAHRWLREHECLALEEPGDEALAMVGVSVPGGAI